MNFKEATELLKQDKKIRRKAWDKSIYLLMSVTDDVKSYIEEAVPFAYDLSIITSHDWVIVGEGDDAMPFTDALMGLLQGKLVKLKEWPTDCFLEATPNGKEVFMRRITEFGFTPTFECFSSTDWEEVE